MECVFREHFRQSKQHLLAVIRIVRREIRKLRGEGRNVYMGVEGLENDSTVDDGRQEIG